MYKIMTGKTPENEAHFLVIFSVLYLVPADVTETHFSLISCSNLSSPAEL